MNSPDTGLNGPAPDSYELPARDRFIDAALAEQARLGHRDDDEFVHRILLETVRRPVTAASPARPAEQDRKLLMTVAASVAATVALAVTVLSVLPFGNSRDQSNEYHFVVQLSDPVATFQGEDEELPLPPSVRPAPAQRVSAPEFVIPSFQQDLSDRVDIEDIQLPIDFSRSLQDLKSNRRRYDRFSVLAQHSETRDGMIVFSGEVVVDHPHYRIRAKTVTIPVNAEGAAALPFKILARDVDLVELASGRTAKADLLEFDPASHRLELRGVDSFDAPEFAGHVWLPGDRLELAGGVPHLVRTEAHAAPSFESK